MQISLDPVGWVDNIMQKQLGIIRNKTEKLQSIKREAVRKKNRFQMVGKEND